MTMSSSSPQLSALAHAGMNKSVIFGKQKTTHTRNA